MKRSMRDRLFNFLFPFGGGSVGATTAFISNITWVHLGEMVFEAAVFAVVGGVIGWAAKRAMDALFKKKSDA